MFSLIFFIYNWFLQSIFRQDQQWASFTSILSAFSILLEWEHHGRKMSATSKLDDITYKSIASKAIKSCDNPIVRSLPQPNYNIEVFTSKAYNAVPTARHQ
jgi:hypothetical protein